MKTLPLPAIRPVPVSEFGPELRAQIAYAWEMPSGEVWALKHSGGLLRHHPEAGASLAETLLDLVEERGLAA